MNPSHEPAGRHRAVYAAAEAVREGRLVPGDLAELRRLDSRDPGSFAFWRLLVRCVEPHDPPPGNESARDAWERRWALVLSGMARLPHEKGRRPGRTLAEAGFSPLRLRRLLRASGPSLADVFQNMVRFLAAKGEALDWTVAADLVFFDPRIHPERAERVRRRVARDFFTQLYRQESKEEEHS